MAVGSWPLAEELFARGADGFVDELRAVHFAERLGTFAPKWYADRRPFARAALLDYLARPFNCYRHEPLVKRLFKLAEAAGDDAVMGAFLVAFDRTLRRKRATRRRYKSEQFSTRAAAETAVRGWLADGFTNANISEYSGRVYAYAIKTEDAVVLPPGTTMPRPPENQAKKDQKLAEWQRAHFQRLFLFSVPTRRYLRRRAWRYFRKLGKSDPARYVTAMAATLPAYTDADADTDIHLLDNWGLTHALFHHCPALVSAPRGWTFAEGKTVADLAPAPAFEGAWVADPDAVFAVLLAANARAVRQWAVAMLRAHHPAWLAAKPVSTLLKLADHPDPDLSKLGFDLLELAPDLSDVPVAEWLARLDGDDLEKLTRLGDLLARRLDPARVSAADALRLAAYPSRPVAALGFAILRQKAFAEPDAADLLPLVQAGNAAVRPDISRWLRATLAGFGPARPEWLIEFLDSKHADVRAAGWAWLADTPFRDDPAVWHKLIESPYEDVRLKLVADLETRIIVADPDRVHWLWATVLTNVARGGRQKPGVVAQIVRRLSEHTRETDRLLPLLAIAVRSLRGPEFRAGLAGLVTLAEAKPELRPEIAARFPELVMSG